MDWSMRVISTPIRRLPSRLMIPAMPHISGSSGGSLRQDLEILFALPVRPRGEVALPLVALVVLEHLVEPARHRALDHLVPGERLERGAEGVRHLLDLHALLEQLVGVALLRLTGVDLVATAVEPRLQQRRHREVRVAGGVDAAVLEAPAGGDAHGGGAVLPAPVLVDGGPEAGVP